MKRSSLTFKFLLKMPKFIVSDPYEVFFAVALFLSGIADISSPKSAGIIGHILPNWQAYMWGSSLTMGGMFTLIGLWGASKAGNMKTLRYFRIIERSGQLIFAIASIIWAFVVFEVAGVAGIASGVFILFFALVCLVKAAIIRGTEELLEKSRAEDS